MFPDVVSFIGFMLIVFSDVITLFTITSVHRRRIAVRKIGLKVQRDNNLGLNGVARSILTILEEITSKLAQLHFLRIV